MHASLPCRPALFLDRDGVINRDTGYVFRPRDFEFLPGIFQSLRRWQVEGYRLVIVTNQSGIGRGLYRAQDFHELTEWMLARFSAEGIRIDGVYHCPHRPEEGCCCRKPQPGMLLKAAADLRLDLAGSWLFGDRLSDIEAASSAGIRQTVLLRAEPAEPAQADVESEVESAAKPLYVRRDVSATLSLLPSTEAKDCTPCLQQRST